jgi:hypothetical protein
MRSYLRIESEEDCNFQDHFVAIGRSVGKKVPLPIQDAIWQFNVARTRCGRCNRFLQQPRREFRIMAILHLPDRVVAATKRPRREILYRGCFAFSTTRSVCFFAH